MRSRWSVCGAKELRIRCQGVFGVNIQLTQKELSDYLSDVFLIVFLKGFNAGVTLWNVHLGSISAVSRVRSLILPEERRLDAWPVDLVCDVIGKLII